MVLGNDQVAQNYGGIDSLPTTFVIDRDGRIASTHVGLVSRRDYDAEVQQLLETKIANRNEVAERASRR